MSEVWKRVLWAGVLGMTVGCGDTAGLDIDLPDGGGAGDASADAAQDSGLAADAASDAKAGEPCDPDPCSHATRCKPKGSDDYECVCEPGWEGKTCAVGIDECAASPCLHSVGCFDGENDYSCACETGWRGKNCQFPTDDCTPNPCANATECADLDSDYECTCRPGWMGKDCDENIDDCDPQPCANGGVCVDGVDEYSCTCEPGWTGKDCDEIDECFRSACVNATACEDRDNDYTCTCAPGWMGKNCDQSIDDCDPNPCVNASACADEHLGYTCTCDAGWAGQNCDDADDCFGDPCANATECIDGDNDYTCTCEVGWQGDDCDINPDDCDPNPCVNAAAGCTDGQDDYTCACDAGWFGTDCDVQCDDSDGATTDWWHPDYGCGHRTGDWTVFDSGLEADHLYDLGWYRFPSSISHADVMIACPTLEFAGHDDWQMPTIDQTRTWAAGCTETAPDGSCPLADPACLDQSCGISTDCSSCTGGNGPGPFDTYCRADMPTCVAAWTSSSCASCGAGFYWYYGPTNGNFVRSQPTGGRQSVCVHALSNLSLDD